jgi:hypothetical protein
MSPVRAVIVERHTILPSGKYCSQGANSVSHSLNGAIKLFAKSPLDMRANLRA